MSYTIYDSDVLVLKMLLKHLKKSAIEDDELKNLLKRGSEIIDPLVVEMHKKYNQMECLSTD